MNNGNYIRIRTLFQATKYSMAVIPVFIQIFVTRAQTVIKKISMIINKIGIITDILDSDTSLESSVSSVSSFEDEFASITTEITIIDIPRKCRKLNFSLNIKQDTIAVVKELKDVKLNKAATLRDAPFAV